MLAQGLSRVLPYCLIGWGGGDIHLAERGLNISGKGVLGGCIGTRLRTRSLDGRGRVLLGETGRTTGLIGSGHGWRGFDFLFSVSSLQFLCKKKTAVLFFLLFFFSFHFLIFLLVFLFFFLSLLWLIGCAILFTPGRTRRPKWPPMPPEGQRGQSGPRRCAAGTACSASRRPTAFGSAPKERAVQVCEWWWEVEGPR